MTMELDPTTDLAAPVPRVRTRRGRPWVVENFAYVIAIAMISVVLLTIVLVPFWSGFEAYRQDLAHAQIRPFQDTAHPLGTDALGRDILSRLAVAGRVSVLIALAVVAINLVLGTTLGLLAGYYRGWLDSFIMGVADLQLALPLIILLIAVIAAVGSSIPTLVIMLGIAFWVRYGRVARIITMSLRQREFLLAPITQGASAPWVIRKHLLPNVMPQMIVLASFDVGVIVIVEASLSYLGLGIQAPTPSWGSMIYEGKTYLQSNAWLAMLPGLMIFLFLAGVQILSQKLTGESNRLPKPTSGASS